MLHVVVHLGANNHRDSVEQRMKRIRDLNFKHRAPGIMTPRRMRAEKTGPAWRH
jgi:hypothetical protein